MSFGREEDKGGSEIGAVRQGRLSFNDAGAIRDQRLRGRGPGRAAFGVDLSISLRRARRLDEKLVPLQRSSKAGAARVARRDVLWVFR